jgi:hypothetical protein
VLIKSGELGGEEEEDIAEDKEAIAFRPKGGGTEITVGLIQSNERVMNEITALRRRGEAEGGIKGSTATVSVMEIWYLSMVAWNALSPLLPNKIPSIRAV